MLKIIAAFFMVIDHIGAVFFPEQLLFRVLGRIAFPLFAYDVAIGIERTRDSKQYLKRMIFWAVIAQIPYFLMLNSQGKSWGLNIMFTFSLAIFLIVRYKEKNKIHFWTALFPCLVLSEILMTDYGFYGILSVLLFYISRDKSSLRNVLFILITTVFVLLTLNISESLVPLIYIFHTLALPIIYIHQRYKDKIRLPKYFFYVFYPAHMLLLWSISKIM